MIYNVGLTIGTRGANKRWENSGADPTGTGAAIPARADSAVESKSSSGADADIEMTRRNPWFQSAEEAIFLGRFVEFRSGRSSI
jgi:hypothetical protein